MLHLVTGSLVFLEVIKAITCRFPERGGCLGTYFSHYIACISQFQSVQQPADKFLRETEAMQEFPTSLIHVTRHGVQDRQLEPVDLLPSTGSFSA